ncbi:hypothetical protein [Streptomyces sp. C10-9-1]|uniref:hypothetical protein n=1 Tax=Streptomyces sp. C10-9-1 TaxID=1859285 RepID=UPI003F49EF00
MYTLQSLTVVMPPTARARSRILLRATPYQRNPRKARLIPLTVLILPPSGIPYAEPFKLT